MLVLPDDGRQTTDRPVLPRNGPAVMLTGVNSKSLNVRASWKAPRFVTLSTAISSETGSPADTDCVEQHKR
jgi:hypothetical protein